MIGGGEVWVARDTVDVAREIVEGEGDTGPCNEGFNSRIRSSRIPAL
jgi:hypothetical protein